MEQVGCLLLGFAVAGPTVLVFRWLVTPAHEVHRPRATNDPPRHPRIAPLSGCDPKAVVELFGSRLYGPKADSARPLSATELISLLGGTDEERPPVVARFDSEGGYRLRL
jgi:hypothetical protein